METKFVVIVRRGEYSRLAEQYKKASFKAKKVTFADFAPCQNPRKEGWLDYEADCKELENLGFINPKPFTEIYAEEIWYRLSTVGGRHRIYYKKPKRYPTTYCLISTVNGSQDGWECFGDSDSKEELQKLANKLWGGVNEYGNRDVYDETYLRNHKIVCKTKARKIFQAYWVFDGEHCRV